MLKLSLCVIFVIEMHKQRFALNILEIYYSSSK